MALRSYGKRKDGVTDHTNVALVNNIVHLFQFIRSPINEFTTILRMACIDRQIHKNHCLVSDSPLFAPFLFQHRMKTCLSNNSEYAEHGGQSFFCGNRIGVCVDSA
jgi:hypothetical protein